jgi:hypothetical protein
MGRIDEKYELPEIRSTIESNIPEHQILLSFNDDYFCHLFQLWWHDDGEELFERYIKKHGT